jgi:hypothetical protein
MKKAMIYFILLVVSLGLSFYWIFEFQYVAMCETDPWVEEMQVKLVNQLFEYKMGPSSLSMTKSKVMKEGDWQIIENTEHGEDLLGSEQFRYKYEFRLTLGLKNYFGSFDVCGVLHEFGPLPS